jgi:hypothetical protein
MDLLARAAVALNALKADGDDHQLVLDIERALDAIFGDRADIEEEDEKAYPE